MVSLRWGLPPLDPERQWEEKKVLNSLWVTNGILYHQTVLTALFSRTLNRGTAATALIVNVAGENTNSVYTEAAAGFTVELDGQRQKLELAEGFVWVLGPQGRCRLGALEVPPSGIKQGSGEALLFSGNMPPSERGSLTLKIPLQRVNNPPELDALTDLVFAEELHRAMKTGGENSSSRTDLLLRFNEQR